jgi:hypothetical protein
MLSKIMGESEFKGTPNDLVWAGKWQPNCEHSIALSKQSELTGR